jgi:hypothetical protein
MTPTQRHKRQGVCANHLVAFKVVDPKFTAIPAVSPNSEDFVSIFGFDCYTGCSKMGRGRLNPGTQRKRLEQCLRQRLGFHRSYKAYEVDAMLSQTLLWIADWTQGEAFFSKYPTRRIMENHNTKVTHFVYS